MIVDTEMTPIEGDLAEDNYGWGQRAPSMGMWPEDVRSRGPEVDYPRNRAEYAMYQRRAAFERSAEYGEAFRGPFSDAYGPGERAFAGLGR